MRILFLLTLINSKAKFHPGIASLSAVLKANGYSTDLLELLTLDYSIIDSTIQEYSPKVVALSSNTHQFDYIREIADYISKKYPSIYLVLGGVHITLNPEDGKLLNGVDAVCKGEGELPLLEYVKSVEDQCFTTNIQNIDFYREKVTYNPQTYYVESLDDLPIPDYGIFRYFKNTKKIKTPVRFLFNRGCPFNCSYCCNHALKNSFPDRKNYVRFMSIARVFEIMKYVADRWDFDEYVIDDDIFTLKKDWFLKFCHDYPEEMRSKSFEINVRIGTIDDAMVKEIKNLNCSLVKFGLESGSEKIRRKILGRKITNRDIIDAAKLFKKHKITFHTFNMVGIPGETRRDIWKTIKLNQIIQPNRLQLTVFYPYAHTTLGDFCYRENLINKAQSDSYFSESILNHEAISDFELYFFIHAFKYLVYRKYDKGLSQSTRMQLLRAMLNLIVHAMPPQIESFLKKINRNYIGI